MSFCYAERIFKNVNSTNSIFYNRVPKCGSSTTMMIINALAEQNGFKMKSARVFTKIYLNNTTEVIFITENAFI